MNNGLVSIITGILAMVSSIIGYVYPYIFFPIALVLSIISIVNGNNARKTQSNQNYGYFGIASGWVAIVLGLIYLLLAIF